MLWITHPRTEAFQSIASEYPAVKVSGPLSHGEMIRHLSTAKLVVTDSGGLIREAVHLGRKTIACHETGIWTDLVDAGAVLRADPTRRSLERAVRAAMDQDEARRRDTLLEPEGGLEIFRHRLLELTIL